MYFNYSNYILSVLSPVCTENVIRVAEAMESAKLAQ